MHEQLSGAARIHFLIAALGTAGDVFPMLAIGKALTARGHRVTVLAAENFRPRVQDAALGFHSVLTLAQCELLLKDPDLWHPRRGFSIAWSGQLAAQRAIVDFAASLPPQERCVMLTHPMALSAAALARARHPCLSVVGAYLAPSNMRGLQDPMTLGNLTIASWVPMAVRRWLWRITEKVLVDPKVLPTLNSLRQSFGLPPLSNFMDHIERVADRSLALFPSWFGATQPEWPQPMLHVGFMMYDHQPDAELSSELKAFLAGGDAPIVFTPGSGYTHGERYFACALRAVQKLGRRAIFLTMHRQQLPPTLPANVLWQDFLPLRLLLPHAAALVYHGGVGTMAEALAAGVPQLVVPCAHDQFDNASRIERMGVGRELRMASLRTGTLVRALRDLLTSPQIEQQCGAARRLLAAGPELAAACDYVEASVRAGEPALT